MSIEAIRELETLASVCPELNMANYTEDDVRHLNDWAIEMSLLVERYALSQQPAQATQTAEVTGEPVYQICKKDSQSISSAWVDVEKQAYEDAGIYPEYGRRTLYTRPAPSVPDDVARDAERYRWLRDHDHWPAPFSSSQEPEPIRGSDLDAAIDAAMLAAK